MSVPDLNIRQLATGDLPFCTRLVEQAGWNQLDGDWLRAMALHPKGCFLAEWNGMPAATTTTCRFGDIAWVAMVLVDQNARNRGIGQAIVAHAVDYLERIGMKTIRLDATVFGKGLYEKLGFQSEYEVVRFKGIAGLADCGNAKKVSTPQLPASLLALSRQITGTEAGGFLQALHCDQPFYQLTNGVGGTLAYAGSRDGRNAVQIGPAAGETEEAGKCVMNAWMNRWHGKTVYIDIPASNPTALNWAERNGLAEQRRFVRMYKGKEVQDRPDKMWACSGPEKG